MGHETKSHLSNMMMKNMSTKTPKNLMMTMEVRILMTQNSMMPQINPLESEDTKHVGNPKLKLCNGMEIH